MLGLENHHVVSRRNAGSSTSSIQAILCDAILTLAFSSYYLSARMVTAAYSSALSFLCAQHITGRTIETQEAIRMLCREAALVGRTSTSHHSTARTTSSLAVCWTLFGFVLIKAGLAKLYLSRSRETNVAESFVVSSIIGHCTLTLMAFMAPYVMPSARPSQWLSLCAFYAYEKAQSTLVGTGLFVLALLAGIAFGVCSMYGPIAGDESSQGAIALPSDIVIDLYEKCDEPFEGPYSADKVSS